MRPLAPPDDPCQPDPCQPVAMFFPSDNHFSTSMIVGAATPHVRSLCRSRSRVATSQIESIRSDPDLQRCSALAAAAAAWSLLLVECKFVQSDLGGLLACTCCLREQGPS